MLMFSINDKILAFLVMKMPKPVKVYTSSQIYAIARHFKWTYLSLKQSLFNLNISNTSLIFQHRLSVLYTHRFTTCLQLSNPNKVIN